jgi:hypothetical protein
MRKEVAMVRQALIVAITALGMCVPIAAAAAELTACGLVTDAELAAFTGGEFERDDMPPSACSVDTMKDDVFNRYLYWTLEQFELPPGMQPYPDYAKDRVAGSAENEKTDGGKPVACKVAGPKYFACFDVKSPMGSFKEGQRAALVMFAKGDAFVRITVFHDERPNLEVGTELAARIYERLP